MTKLIFTVMLILLSVFASAAENGREDGWKIVADTYDDNYTGIPVANGGAWNTSVERTVLSQAHNAESCVRASK